MMYKKYPSNLKKIVLTIFFLFHSSPVSLAKPQNKTIIPVKVGVILGDLEHSVTEKIWLSCIKLAISDFYASHAHYKTRLVLNIRESKNNIVAAAAKDLLCLSFGSRERPRRGRLKGGLRFRYGGSRINRSRWLAALLSGGWVLLWWVALMRSMSEKLVWPGLEAILRSRAWRFCLGLIELWVSPFELRFVMRTVVLQGDQECLKWWSAGAQMKGARSWVSRSDRASMNLGCFWAQFNFLLGQTSPWVWIWDPGDLRSGCYFSFTTCNILGVMRLLLGKLIIATFYEESQYNRAVSTTIECLGEQCVLGWDEFSFDWSTNSLHTRIADTDDLLYKSQGHDNGAIVGNYLEEAGILSSVFAKFSISASEQCFIVKGQIVGGVQLLICSYLALWSSRIWLLYAPNLMWDALMSDFCR